MKIFINMGGFDGATCNVMLDKKYKFDKVIYIEPIKKLCEDTRNKYKDKRLEIYNFGLLDKTCQKKLFGVDGHSASIFKNRRRPLSIDKTEICDFVKASDFFKEHISKADYVIVKINCEGAEYAIINDLLDSREYEKITFALISFDIRSCISYEHQYPELKNKLINMGFNNWIDMKKMRRERSIDNEKVLHDRWEKYIIGK